MATLPPWLEVTPQVYLGAAEAGGRLGSEAANRIEGARQFNENISLNFGVDLQVHKVTGFGSV